MRQFNDVSSFFPDNPTSSTPGKLSVSELKMLTAISGGFRGVAHDVTISTSKSVSGSDSEPDSNVKPENTHPFARGLADDTFVLDEPTGYVHAVG